MTDVSEQAPLAGTYPTYPGRPANQDTAYVTYSEPAFARQPESGDADFLNEDYDNGSGSESGGLPGSYPAEDFGAPAPKEVRQQTEEAEDEYLQRREAAIARLAGVVEDFRTDKEERSQEKLLRRRGSRCSTLPWSFEAGGQAAAAAVAAAAAAAADAESPDSAEDDRVVPVPRCMSMGDKPRKDPNRYSSAPVTGAVCNPETACIIFDWDDTLFPTWYIQNVIRPCAAGTDPGCPVPEMFVETLRTFADDVASLLRKARSVARVAIVTLAQRPWAEQSARIYLPGLNFDDLIAELDIPLYYARECVRKQEVRLDEEGVNMFVIAKRNAMVKCLSKMRKKVGVEQTNIVAIGDSIVEHEAIKEVVWSWEGHHLCKSVLLLDKPPVEILRNEIQVLCSGIEKMVAYTDDFDFNMENGSSDSFTKWL